jgi:hypothetical protein
LGSVADGQQDPNDMSIALLTTIALVGVVCVVAAVTLVAPTRTPPHTSASPRPAIGVGVVRAIADVVTIEVESVSGQTFTGRLRRREGDPVASGLRPGVVVLVAFDPAAREQLSLPDDMIAVRAAFDQMLVGKGLITGEQLDLIRHGTKSRGVVVGMRPTGTAREDYREVELDLMVSRPEGGQFPAHEIALIPASSLAKVCPGNVIDTYYRPGDESAIAVCVPPG